MPIDRDPWPRALLTKIQFEQMLALRWEMEGCPENFQHLLPAGLQGSVGLYDNMLLLDSGLSINFVRSVAKDWWDSQSAAFRLLWRFRMLASALSYTQTCCEMVAEEPEASDRLKEIAEKTASSLATVFTLMSDHLPARASFVQEMIRQHRQEQREGRDEG